MKKICCTLYLPLLTFFFLFSVVHADTVSRVVFSTPSQHIAQNTRSEPIIIQSRDAFGNVVSVSETYDIALTSSSGTGQFETDMGKKIGTTTTMSKNTANRTVYYMDSAEGSFLLTLRATGRTSTRTFSDTQMIVVGTSRPIVLVASTSTITSQISKISSTVHVAVKSSAPMIPKTEKPPATTGTIQVAQSSQTAQIVQAPSPVFETSQKPGILHRVFAWPISVCDSILRFFFGD